jgi:hypothetical protein
VNLSSEELDSSLCFSKCNLYRYTKEQNGEFVPVDLLSGVVGLYTLNAVAP